MVNTYQKLTQIHTDMHSALLDLRQETFRLLLITVGIIIGLAHFYIGFQRPDYLIESWMVVGVLGLISWAALSLSKRQIKIAEILWLVGLATSILLAVYLFREPEFIYLLALLPLLAVALLGNWGGIAAEAALVLLLVGWRAIPGHVTIPDPTGWVTALSGCISALLGWAVVRTLEIATSWSLYGLEQAHLNLQEARQHRAHLATLIKDLDMAYYRLERANSALVAAYKQVDRAEQFKSDFIARVSHEMRTPLNLIAGFAEMILSSPENYAGEEIPGPYRSDINSIYVSSQHLLNIVDDVLDLARMEMGKMTLLREQVDLATLVHEASGMIQEYLAAKKLNLQIQLPPSGLPIVYIDRLRIRQVLLNLLVNAARFTEQGSITVAADVQNGQVFLRVSDTGKGIPPQELSQIFEEFHSTPQPESPWHSGSGLGLPISKKYVELHQGQMGVESTPGQGSTFWFTLPLGPPTAEPGAQNRLQPELNYLAATRQALDSLQPERIIVVVTGDPRTSAVLQHYFENFTLLWVESFTDAVIKARETFAIAILVDAALPIPESLPGDLFILRCPLPNYHHVASKIGVSDFILKPFSAQNLMKAIHRVNRGVERILVVDDDPEIVKLIQRMLYPYLSEGRLQDAYSGFEALEKMRAAPPDLLLMDLSMPDLDGYGVLTQMKADPALKDIPVIILSGMPEDLSSRLEGHIQVTYTVGFNLVQITQAVEGILTALAPGWLPSSPGASAPPEASSG